MDIYMERESLLVRVKIPFKKEEDILEDKVFIKFFEIVKNCNGIIEKEEIFYLKDKNYRTFLVKFGEVKNARTFNEIFLDFIRSVKNKKKFLRLHKKPIN